MIQTAARPQAQPLPPVAAEPPALLPYHGPRWQLKDCLFTAWAIALPLIRGSREVIRPAHVQHYLDTSSNFFILSVCHEYVRRYGMPARSTLREGL